MENFYVYILQVNIGLAVFYLLYRMLFARDTFLKVRRFFLLVILCLAFFYPVVPLAEWLQDRQPLPVILPDYTGFIVNAVQVQPEKEAVSFTVEDVLLGVWLAGVAVLAIRLLVQLCSVFRLRLAGSRQKITGTKVIALKDKTAPFSFFRWIFVNPAYYNEKELEEILTHEKAHVSQLHSWDMLAGEMLCILFWFNPAAWFIRFEIRQNLEFLADRGVLASGCDRKNYQYHLLRLSNQSAAAQIINNFNVSQLKKRIMMMNKRKASKLGLIKYALLLPVTGCLILASNGRTVAEVAHEAVISAKIPAEAPANQRVIKGVVVNADGNPIPSVTVAARINKKTKAAVTTGPRGEFFIKVGDEANELYFAYPGMQPEYRSIDKGTADLRIVMKAPMKLDNVVVMSRRVASEPDGDEVFMAAQEAPKFPGGKSAASLFIAKNINYPVSALEEEVEGTVTVAFVISKKGRVVAPKVTKSVSESLDQEALRVVGMMPEWTPGKQDGVPVAVQSSIDIEFKLSSGHVPAEGKMTGAGASSENLEVIPEQISRDLYMNAVRLVTPGKEIVLLDGKLVKDKNEIPDDLDKIKGINIIKDQQAVQKYIKKYGVKGECVVLIDTK